MENQVKDLARKGFEEIRRVRVVCLDRMLGELAEELHEKGWSITASGPYQEDDMPAGRASPKKSMIVVEKPACDHRLVDARNEAVSAGYMCVDCGAVFAAADH